jgi:hypothetical protein
VLDEPVEGFRLTCREGPRQAGFGLEIQARL